MSEDNKEIPSVGKKSNNQTAGFVLLTLILAIMVYGIYSGSSKPEKVEDDEAEYNISGYSNKRLLDRKPESKPKNVVKNDERRDMTREEMIELLKTMKAMQMAEENSKAAKEAELQAKLEDAKRKSSIIVFQNTGKNHVASSPGISSEIYPNNFGAVGGLVSEKPPIREDRLQLEKPKSVEVTKAGQIHDMSQMVGAGKFIQGVLETAVDSTLPGQVRAVVSTDLYSENGQNVLIPKGSRLVGQYQSGIRQGQNRVFVIWSHVTTPTGIQVALESSGTDALGTAGMSGDYDSHFFKRFGAALLLSVIESYENNENDLNISTGNSLDRASSIALDKSINIPPTIYVDQGEKINVFIARNLSFGS